MLQEIQRDCNVINKMIKVDVKTPEADHLKTDLKDSKEGEYTATYLPQCDG